MINQDRFRLALRDVVREHFPDELEMFDLESDSMVKEVYASSKITEDKLTAEFAFIEAGTAIITFVGLIAATFTAVCKAVQDGKATFLTDEKKHNVERDLELELIHHKIKAVDAATIAHSIIAKLFPQTGSK